MSKVVGRIDKVKTFQISGTIDETTIGNTMSLDANGNLAGKEIVEVLQEVKKVETTQTDFNAGTLTNCAVNSSGYITVVQAVGATTTILEDFEDTTYQFTFTGNATPWARDTTASNAYAGSGSWKAAAITPTSGTHKQTTTQFSYTVPAGSINPTVSGYYKVSSELGYDFFSIQVNGVEQVRDSGNQTWKHFSYPLAIGSNTILFTYDIDGATSAYSNTAWIDNIQVSYQASAGQSVGNRISPSVDLSTIPDKISSTNISWTSNVPSGTSLVVATSISTDGGTTWGAWYQQTNGSAISNLSANQSTAGLRLRTRATFTSNSDSTAIPILYDITVDVFGYHEYKIGKTTLQVGHFEEGVTLV